MGGFAGPHDVSHALIVRARIAAGTRDVPEQLDRITTRVLCPPTGGAAS
ncbi:hypothetical protein [Streptomyces aureoversilis]|uniref:Uncharacterized protein n=1 Tax=Streptomyces aureoversilis TaxID=67277 RepID=A0ABV9ZT79_9ACTN